MKKRDRGLPENKCSQSIERNRLQDVLDANPGLIVTEVVILGRRHAIRNGQILKAPIPIPVENTESVIYRIKKYREKTGVSLKEGWDAVRANKDRPKRKKR